MAITQVGVIYNIASGIVMNINILEPGEDDSWLGTKVAVPGPGQALALVPIAKLRTLSGGALGPKDFRLASVLAANAANSGPALIQAPIVVQIDIATALSDDVYLADTAVWKPPGKIVFANAVAGVGWTFDPKAATLTSPPQVDVKTGLPVASTIVSVPPNAVAAGPVTLP